MKRPVAIALASAALFGGSTPLSKLLIADVAPQLLAALLYLGSGLGLTAALVTRAGLGTVLSGLHRRKVPWLAGAIVSGGIVAPLALMLGLRQTPAASASLLMNLEGVFTALIAWFVFKENFDARVALGMLLIVVSGLFLCYKPGEVIGLAPGALLIALACLAWAVDNNFTCKVSLLDPILIASLKGWVAGGINLTLAVGSGAQFPTLNIILSALAIGAFSYGISLSLFIVALRELGSARTGAYFSTAPFMGAAASLVIFGVGVDLWFWPACALAAVGVWLHVSERHEHEHTHEAMEHAHSHYHDEHHQHAHDGTEPPGEPHSHWHRHERLTHSHPHYPDIHHRHAH